MRNLVCGELGWCLAESCNHSRREYCGCLLGRVDKLATARQSQFCVHCTSALRSYLVQVLISSVIHLHLTVSTFSRDWKFSKAFL